MARQRATHSVNGHQEIERQRPEKQQGTNNSASLSAKALICGLVEERTTGPSGLGFTTRKKKSAGRNSDKCTVNTFPTMAGRSAPSNPGFGDVALFDQPENDQTPPPMDLGTRSFPDWWSVQRKGPRRIGDPLQKWGVGVLFLNLSPRDTTNTRNRSSYRSFTRGYASFFLIKKSDLQGHVWWDRWGARRRANDNFSVLFFTDSNQARHSSLLAG
ncbi:hypothetical protein MGG_17200 [Pyricularia oryzae 70-15]|uniref:Uncharacterized protein n=4 Tax=Pyricularia oryzae TaxID=318829 RepID=G4N8E0_PYRO7|nr:uncharacterized protein MGG_17200 [Pyricularia oryzae 70-15]EHA50988.1 hypothetical protein MGG_17200 [Pyricularia oryzae 70-15]